jgi:hypothetical protein
MHQRGGREAWLMVLLTIAGAAVLTLFAKFTVSVRRIAC